MDMKVVDAENKRVDVICALVVIGADERKERVRAKTVAISGRVVKAEETDQIDVAVIDPLRRQVPERTTRLVNRIGAVAITIRESESGETLIAPEKVNVADVEKTRLASTPRVCK
jgi:hypothetical protein